jgi:hypothetical protein
MELHSQTLVNRIASYVAQMLNLVDATELNIYVVLLHATSR